MDDNEEAKKLCETRDEIFQSLIITWSVQLVEWALASTCATRIRARYSAH